jgi:hypothetical protein
MRKHIALLPSLLLLQIAANAIIDASPRYRVEFHKPVRGAEGVYTLDVIFSHRATAAEADRVLRRELGVVLQRAAPDGNILASAWYSPTGEQIDEDLVALPDGSLHLVYVRKLKKILTFDEYERTKKR